MIAIHQSQFMPWPPFFFKLISSDVFVVLDHVQFQKNGVQNRNMLKSPNGGTWVTVPVNRSLTTTIQDVRVTNKDIGTKILKTLEMWYNKSPFFTEVYGALNPVLAKPYEFLHELNSRILETMLELLQVKPKIIYSRTLGLTQRKGDLVIEIIKKLGQQHYLSGHGALEYMDMQKFQKEGIEVSVSNFSWLPYSQQWESKGFISELSTVDLLFNQLPQARKYILDQGIISKQEYAKEVL